ncbi:MAG: mechanosensitive ion channel domain-containing protein [Acidimicrobiia bacterium]
MEWVPSIAAAVITLVSVFAMRSVETRRWAGDASERTFRKQVYTFGILFVGLLVVIFLLPSGTNQELALGVTGLVVTGALAISSQSIIANGMAGLLLRSLKKFKPGDFIEVNERVGRVTELGLFHTEIQTNDRDLTTLPNSLMVNQPVKVVRASGTIVSANISIGYDVSRHRLRPLFMDAAERAELRDPFVQVMDLGDYSVVYRVAGFLDTPERMLAARSTLRGAMLDTLHEAGVEIMSPMYVATRNRDAEVSVPARSTVREAPDDTENGGEEQIFDKAEIASAIETHRASIFDLEARIDDLESHKDADGVESDSVVPRIEACERKIAHHNREIEDLEELLRAR